MDIHILTKLFEKKFNSPALSVQALPPSGSARRYFRIKNQEYSSIGVYNQDISENNAFLYFTEHFLKKGLPVPQIYSSLPGSEYYLLEDLGDTTLKDYADEIRNGKEIPASLVLLYKQALSELIKFQLAGHEGLDYSMSVPRSSFDLQSILWDLNHFKYFFLKVSDIPFNEQKLENDFHTLADFLISADSDAFLYRDFQSRNIMVHNSKLYFIDYQGGRRGALQYDVASLLFEGKTDIPTEIREELLQYYLDELFKYRATDREVFIKYYYPYVLIRILQALGAYGLRGIIEKKQVFLQSIPFALKNLSWILENVSLPIEIPELIKLGKKLTALKKYQFHIEGNTDLLTVRIFSFSYRKGIPDDLSGNGGGFVFDCRGIHNPGRYPEYRELTGKDEAVAQFLSEKSEMNNFLEDVHSLIARHIRFYQDSGYKHMQVSFGCTGGRHRSVYAAEKTAELLNKRDDILVILQHTVI